MTLPTRMARVMRMFATRTHRPSSLRKLPTYSSPWMQKILFPLARQYVLVAVRWRDMRDGNVPTLPAAPAIPSTADHPHIVLSTSKSLRLQRALRNYEYKKIDLARKEETTKKVRKFVRNLLDTPEPKESIFYRFDKILLRFCLWGYAKMEEDLAETRMEVEREGERLWDFCMEEEGLAKPKKKEGANTKKQDSKGK
ncbi:hypothetical protein BDV95DRAFT_158696 [Massariosphaeria phaeospora]|uniref:Uncharacterized protein n=1 Tax=Massariosphaeria phaeospora TaxID=100035 RepID=A0A7C8MIT4_9PLEO|nr:hypothetical protein BDV95DRAFT_158696 [Massariosphaeria phaeospora]